MNDSPVMRASDEELTREFTMSKSQHTAMVFMASVQVILIVLVYLLMVLQAVTSISFGIGAAPALVVFVVVYLYFVRTAMMLAENGIRVRWVNVMRVINPMLFVIGCLICVCTI